MVAVVGLVVVIITVGSVISLVLRVVLIHIVDVFLVSFYDDLLDCARCILFEDCWIDWYHRCTV